MTSLRNINTERLHEFTAVSIIPKLQGKAGLQQGTWYDARTWNIFRAHTSGTYRIHRPAADLAADMGTRSSRACSEKHCKRFISSS